MTQLNQDSCIDAHHEIFKDTPLVSYGRGYPRPVYVGSSPRMIMAHLPKAKILDYYQRFSAELGQVNFAKDADDYLKLMHIIKKQGYYFLIAILIQILQAYLYRFIFHLKMRLMS